MNQFFLHYRYKKIVITTMKIKILKIGHFRLFLLFLVTHTIF
jgi:hypothetical protein